MYDEPMGIITSTPTGQLRNMREAIDREIAARERQLDTLTATLEKLIEAGASDAVIERVMQAIEIVDAATPAPVSIDPEPEPEPEPEPSDPRRVVIAELRSQGYMAPGFDALVRLYHRDLAELEWRKAEDDTRGHMTRPGHTGYSTRNFWFCNERELRAHASEELLTWFDTNGRLTFRKLRDQLLTGQHYAGSGYLNDR